TVSALLDLQERVLLCLDRRTGKILWHKTVLQSPLEKKHSLNSYASSTPATDGEQVYVAFLDRQAMVVAAYDFDGNQTWLVRTDRSVCGLARLQREGRFALHHGRFSGPPHPCHQARWPRRRDADAHRLANEQGRRLRAVADHCGRLFPDRFRFGRRALF